MLPAELPNSIAYNCEPSALAGTQYQGMAVAQRSHRGGG
jgi:hypothetical protein